jgi:hypothetical protein
MAVKRSAKIGVNFSFFTGLVINRTRMTRIRRIFTNPCVSVSSVQSVFYLTVFLLNDDKWIKLTYDFNITSSMLPLLNPMISRVT